MKRLVPLLIVCILMNFMASCSQGSKSNEESTTQSTVLVTPTPSPTPTPTPTSTPTPTPTPKLVKGVGYFVADECHNDEDKYFEDAVNLFSSKDSPACILTFDEGRMIKSTYYNAVTLVNYGGTLINSEYTYTDDGVLQKIMHYDQGKITGRTEYFFDTMGRIEREKFWYGTEFITVEYFYDSDDRLAVKRYANKEGILFLTSLEYDEDGRLIREVSSTYSGTDDDTSYVRRGADTYPHPDVDIFPLSVTRYIYEGEQLVRKESTIDYPWYGFDEAEGTFIEGILHRDTTFEYYRSGVLKREYEVESYEDDDSPIMQHEYIYNEDGLLETYSATNAAWGYSIKLVFEYSYE